MNLFLLHRMKLFNSRCIYTDYTTLLHSKRKNWNILKARQGVQYLLGVSPNVRVWHKAFLKRVRVQGCCPDMPSIHKNALGPIGISLKGVLQAPGNKPSPFKEG